MISIVGVVWMFCRVDIYGNDLCCCNYVAVCRGGICESDLCRRSFIDIGKGCIYVVVIFLVFAKEMFVRVIVSL